MADPRDPDEVSYLARLRSDLDELTKNVIGRSGRIPHIAADPTTPPDGSIWIRSDNSALSYRASGVTSSLPLGSVGSKTVTLDQTLIGAAQTQITNYTVTFTALAGRRYAMFFTFATGQVTAGGTQLFNWTLAGASQTIISRDSNIVAGQFRTVSGYAELGVLGAGSKVIGVDASTSAGTLTIANLSWMNARMNVFDIGV